MVCCIQRNDVVSEGIPLHARSLELDTSIYPLWHRFDACTYLFLVDLVIKHMFHIALKPVVVLDLLEGPVVCFGSLFEYIDDPLCWCKVW